MENSKDFLERTRELRAALKKRALEVESGIISNSSHNILESHIQKNIQSSFEYSKNSEKKSRISSFSTTDLAHAKKLISNEKKHNDEDPLKLPEIKKIYKPYLMKPNEFPLPYSKRIKGYKVNFTGNEPKIKKLKQAYSSLTSRDR